jgi:predicted transcriptional regulator
MIMKQRLTAKEEEIMNLIWAHDEICIRDILRLMPDPKPNYNTVATQVKFLEDKGLVKRKPVANTYLYSPAMTREEYSGLSIGSLVEKYFENSYMSVVSHFIREEKMNVDDLKELIAMIENNK